MLRTPSIAAPTTRPYYIHFSSASQDSAVRVVGRTLGNKTFQPLNPVRARRSMRDPTQGGLPPLYPTPTTCVALRDLVQLRAPPRSLSLFYLFEASLVHATFSSCCGKIAEGNDAVGRRHPDSNRHTVGVLGVGGSRGTRQSLSSMTIASAKTLDCAIQQVLVAARCSPPRHLNAYIPTYIRATLPLPQ